MVYTLVYVSSARSRFGREDLEDILAVSRRNNAAADVSGMLLYRDGSLMQVLEGEETVVRTVFERIATDPRHHGIIPVWEGKVSHRQFPDWSMAFHDVSGPEAAGLPGYSRFLQVPLTAQVFGDEPSLVQQLLLVFKDQYATTANRRGPRTAS